MLESINYLRTPIFDLLDIGSTWVIIAPEMTAEAKVDPATEAWGIALEIVLGERPPRVPAVAAAFDVSPMGLKLLYKLEPAAASSMRALADTLFCDASNVTGIVDRLEARGLIERREDPGDRRVKLIALTAEGEDVHAEIRRRLHEPPAPIAALSEADRVALRDILRRAVGA